VESGFLILDGWDGVDNASGGGFGRRWDDDCGLNHTKDFGSMSWRAGYIE